MESVGLGIRGPGVQYPLRVTFCYRNFLFLISKVSDANMGIIANFVYYGKTRMVFVTEFKDLKESLTTLVEEQCLEKTK